GLTIQNFSGSGIVLNSDHITIGGTGSGGGNTIISNRAHGISISGPGAKNNLVAGNRIAGNTGHGVEVTNVGGAGATGNLIVGNYIGVANDGTTDLGNDRDGVLIFGVAGNTVGGTDADDGMVD